MCPLRCGRRRGGDTVVNRRTGRPRHTSDEPRGNGLDVVRGGVTRSVRRRVPVAVDEERIWTVDITLKRLPGRTKNVAEEKLTQLRDMDWVEFGEFWLSPEIRVSWEEWRNQYEVSEFLDEGGCDCSPDG